MTGQSEQSTARQAGRGVFWLTIAKFYFMGTGFLLVIFLPKLFEQLSGDASGELYGRYRVVIGLVNLLNMILIGGTIQAVSKFISEKESRAASVKWVTLKLQTVIGGILSLLLLLGADFVATHFYGQPELAFYLRLAAPIVLLYSYYAVIIGGLNGLKRFRNQAFMDILFASCKVGFTIVFVAAGYAIAGAIGGFLVTAALLLVVSWFVLGKPPEGEEVSWRDIFSFEWKTLVYAFFLNALLQVDLQLLMAMAPPELGSPDSQAGIFGLALQLGQLPYVATIAVAFVIFPLMSRATFDKDQSLVRSYVSTTNRYVFLGLVGVVAAVACDASGIMSLPFFPKVYAGGSDMFAALSVGYLFFAMVVVNASILTGSGRPMVSVFLFAGMLVVSVTLNLILIPRFGGIGAAFAAGGAMLAGCVAAGITVHRLFGTFMPPLSVVRAVLAGGLVVLYALYVEPQWGGLVMLVLRLGVKVVLYFAILALLREITPGEVKEVLALRRGGR